MLGSRIHRYIFLFGICTLGGAIAIGEVPTSIAEIILFANWLLEGKFRQKWTIIKTNKLLWLLCSVFILHLIGLIYTTDFHRGIDDVRIKIPLMLLPLVFFTSAPLSKKELNISFYLFTLGVLINCSWCLLYYHRHPGMDIRTASRFISHIRLGLIIDFCICVLAYLIFITRELKYRLLFAAIILFLLFSIVKLSLITGLVILILLTAFCILYFGAKQKPVIRLVSVATVGLVIVTILFYIWKEWKAYSFIDTSAANTPKTQSASGRPYSPVMDNRHTENGFYIAYNIQYQELHNEWRKRSHTLLYSTKDEKHTAWALIRYLSSKGYTKDSAGIAKLSDEDIRNIEKGATNYKYVHAPELNQRLKEFFWEYQDYRYNSNPTGNTMLMRFEFWKAAVYIIKRHLLFGVGTGDSQKWFDRAYSRTNSVLSLEWRLRSHNQYLAMTVAFGLAGGLLFLFSLLYPFIKLRKYTHLLYTAFFMIVMISFVTEDTLETQTGVTFFAYFNALFLWLADAEYRRECGLPVRNDNP